MSVRLSLKLALCGAFLLSCGCRGRTAPETGAGTGSSALAPTEGSKQVTLHVKDMVERLKLF